MDLLTPKIVVANPIPDEVRIYYYKDIALLKAIVNMVALGIGICFLEAGVWIVGLPFTIVGAYNLFSKVKMLLTSGPQVIINKQGVQTADIPFYTWEHIKGITITGKWDTRGEPPRLRYQCPQGKTSVRVDHLNITAHNLNILLKFYQHPWEFKEYNK